jgi:hypothetical protein
MNIILGNEAADKLKHNYTVLELETFTRQDQSSVTAYAVVDNIPLSELTNLTANKQLHENFIKAYNSKNYNYCLNAVDHLLGKFNGELDSFYVEIIQRIKAQ